MTLKDYYENLPPASCPKTEFVRRIANRCGVSEPTVRNWISYGMKPINQEHRVILSEETGIALEELFS